MTLKFHDILSSVRQWDRFRVAQIIFILAITFGPFFSDTVRKILFFMAIFFAGRSQIKDVLNIFQTNVKVLKVYAISLCIFWLYVTIVPVFCGVDSLSERFKSIGYPLEIMFWIFGTAVFARDVFFIRCLVFGSICASSIYSAIAWPYLISTNFVVNHSYYYAWPLSLASWSVGSILVCLFAWLMYAVLYREEYDRWKANLEIFLFLLVGGVIVLTLYATFWLVGFMELIMTIFIILRYNKKRICSFCKKMSVIILCILVLFLFCINIFPSMKTAINSQVSQVTAIGKDITKFTNKRDLVWKEAVELIKKRPMRGYGWAEYEYYSQRKMDHTHSSFLQIAWTAGILPVVLFVYILFMAFYICCRELRKSSGNAPMPFVLLLVLTAFTVNGCLDNLFDATRRVETLYWCYLSLPMCHAFSKNIDEDICTL